MGCNTSKSARTYNSMAGGKNRQQKPRPMWYNSEWDSVTDSQTASTYLDRTGASTCSLRRDGTDKARGVGDGRSDPDDHQESTESEEAQEKPPPE